MANIVATPSTIVICCPAALASAKAAGASVDHSMPRRRALDRLGAYHQNIVKLSQTDQEPIK